MILTIKPVKICSNNLVLIKNNEVVGSIYNQFAAFSAKLNTCNAIYNAKYDRDNQIYILLESDKTISTATINKLTVTIDCIYFNQIKFKLNCPYVFKKRYELYKNDETIGYIEAKFGLTRKLVAEVPDFIPMELVLFKVWLLPLLWKMIL